MDTNGDEEIEITDERFKLVMSQFATGVTIVTALDVDVPVGLTCQSFVSISLSPPLVAFAPAKTSSSWPKIARSPSFCVNILSVRQKEICLAFANSGHDKFADVQWERTRHGAPMIKGAIAWVECSIDSIYDVGDHDLVVARVLTLAHVGGPPLLYFQGQLTPGAFAQTAFI